MIIGFPTEKVWIVVVIASTTHTEPSPYDEYHVEQDGYPVDAEEYAFVAFFLSYHCYRLSFSCSVINMAVLE